MPRKEKQPLDLYEDYDHSKLCNGKEDGQDQEYGFYTIKRNGTKYGVPKVRSVSAWVIFSVVAYTCMSAILFVH